MTMVAIINRRVEKLKIHLYLAFQQWLHCIQLEHFSEYISNFLIDHYIAFKGWRHSNSTCNLNLYLPNKYTAKKKQRRMKEFQIIPSRDDIFAFLSYSTNKKKNFARHIDLLVISTFNIIKKAQQCWLPSFVPRRRLCFDPSHTMLCEWKILTAAVELSKRERERERIHWGWRNKGLYTKTNEQQASEELHPITMYEDQKSHASLAARREDGEDRICVLNK